MIAAVVAGPQATGRAAHQQLLAARIDSQAVAVDQVVAILLRQPAAQGRALSIDPAAADVAQPKRTA